MKGKGKAKLIPVPVDDLRLTVVSEQGLGWTGIEGLEVEVTNLNKKVDDCMGQMQMQMSQSAIRD